MRTIKTVGLITIVMLALMACQLLPAGRPSPDLAGTSWLLSSLDGALPQADTVVILEFGTDDTASGSDGCNQFRTSYSQRRDGLTFGRPTAATQMACAGPVMEQGTAFMAALAATEGFIAGDRELILTDGDDILATFVAISQDLEGTSWDVVSYNNGRGAVVSLLLNTEITANFDDGGALSGNAGCNQYRAAYSVVADTIDIGPAATTRRSCPQPAGVMDQENEYLAALESASTYSIQANRLEMRTADGQLAVSMTRSLGVERPPTEPTVGTPTVTAEAPAKPPAATPSPRPPTATPTSPPLPTATPLPEIAFWADRTSIDPGQCTMLRWSVQNVQALWVYPRGEPYDRYPRTGEGSEQVCLVTTTTYEMRVLLLDDSTVFREVTIHVTAPTPTATSTPAIDPLAGTDWEVVSYNDGRGALVSLIIGSRIFVEFGTEGQVTGNGGCNDYVALYQAAGDSITISQASTTNLFCAEPEGLMAQETAFLAALQSAATFRIRGDTLELRTAGNEVAVTATRLP